MFSPPKIRGTPITPMRLVAINQRNFRNANMVRQSVPRDSFQGDVEDVPRTSLRSDSHVLAHLRRRPSLPHRGVGAPYPLLSLFAYKVFTCHLAQRPGSSFNYAALPRVHTHTRLRYPTGRSSRIVISRNPRGNSIEGWIVASCYSIGCPDSNSFDSVGEGSIAFEANFFQKPTAPSFFIFFSFAFFQSVYQCCLFTNKIKFPLILVTYRFRLQTYNMIYRFFQ